MDLVLVCSNGNVNKHEGNSSNKWLLELILKVAQCHLVVFLTLGADLLEEVYNQVMPVHLILNLHWGTIVKILYYYNFITLAIRISWSSVRIISCLCGILEMQK